MWDLHQMKDNSVLYNGADHLVTQRAQQMIDRAREFLSKHHTPAELEPEPSLINRKLTTGQRIDQQQEQQAAESSAIATGTEDNNSQDRIPSNSQSPASTDPTSSTTAAASDPQSISSAPVSLSPSASSLSSPSLPSFRSPPQFSPQIHSPPSTNHSLSTIPTTRPSLQSSKFSPSSSEMPSSSSSLTPSAASFLPINDPTAALLREDRLDSFSDLFGADYQPMEDQETEGLELDIEQELPPQQQEDPVWLED